VTRLWQRFVAPTGDADLPELDRLLVRGVRVAALVYAPLLLPLALALALRGGLRVADALAVQLAAQAAIWTCFAVSHTPLGRRRPEALLFMEVALGNAALLLGDPRRHGDASALSWAALFAPVLLPPSRRGGPSSARAGRGDGGSAVWFCPRAPGLPADLHSRRSPAGPSAHSPRAHRTWRAPRPPRARPPTRRGTPLSADKASPSSSPT
jgi:hypothetical protein